MAEDVYEIDLIKSCYTMIPLRAWWCLARLQITQQGCRSLDVPGTIWACWVGEERAAMMFGCRRVGWRRATPLRLNRTALQARMVDMHVVDPSPGYAGLC